jgi:hypothetical protein
MPVLTGLGGVLLILVVLWDAFETVVLPRRVARQAALTVLFYRLTWWPWAAAARRVRADWQREELLSFYGPLSLLLLLGLWVIGLSVGFAAVSWALAAMGWAPGEPAEFGAHLYLSGTTFFNYGREIPPSTPLTRALTLMEVGAGFGVLAAVISYLPMLYQTFSRRELHVSLLDARAGSPPTALELLRRHGDGDPAAFEQLLHDWESWAAELLESHLSYPVLAYFRSQHDYESWLASLTAILDVCALALVGIEGVPDRQARFTFAIARHAAGDLSQVFGTPPQAPEPDRLPPRDLLHLRAALAAAGRPLREGEDADRKLAELRHLYEPYVNALARHLLMALPPWIPDEGGRDDWRVTAWEAL